MVSYRDCSPASDTNSRIKPLLRQNPSSLFLKPILRKNVTVALSQGLINARNANPSAVPIAARPFFLLFSDQDDSEAEIPVLQRRMVAVEIPCGGSIVALVKTPTACHFPADLI